MNTDLHSMLQDLIARDVRPAPYAPGDANIWTDSHLSHGMLKAHLDADTDAASFRPAMRRALLDFLDAECPPETYPAVLELGCGPGLYTQDWARRGRRVTGVDFSAGSIAYARSAAARENLPIRYIEGDYLSVDFSDERGSGYDMVAMISYDFGVLPPDGRARLLRGIFEALRPGGVLFLDVFTSDHPSEAEHQTWEIGCGGYWSEGEYLLLNRLLQYDDCVNLMRHILIDAQGVRAFHVWEHLFTPQELIRALTDAGFSTPALFADHAGAPFRQGGPQVCALARKG